MAYFRTIHHVIWLVTLDWTWNPNYGCLNFWWPWGSFIDLAIKQNPNSWHETFGHCGLHHVMFLWSQSFIDHDLLHLTQVLFKLSTKSCSCFIIVFIHVSDCMHCTMFPNTYTNSCFTVYNTFIQFKGIFKLKFVERKV